MSGASRPSMQDVQENTAYDYGAPTERLGPDKCPFCKEESEGIRRHSPQPCVDMIPEFAKGKTISNKVYRDARREMVREKVLEKMREGLSISRARGLVSREQKINRASVYQYTRNMEKK